MRIMIVGAGMIGSHLSERLSVEGQVDLAMAGEIMHLINVSAAFEAAEFARGQVELLGYIAQEGCPFTVAWRYHQC